MLVLNCNKGTVLSTAVPHKLGGTVEPSPCGTFEPLVKLESNPGPLPV